LTLTKEYLEACAVDDNPAFDSLDIQNILINQKLRKLLEKKIASLPGQIEGAISPSWKTDYELLQIEFNSLLEDSKK